MAAAIRLHPTPIDQRVGVEIALLDTVCDRPHRSSLESWRAAAAGEHTHAARMGAVLHATVAQRADPRRFAVRYLAVCSEARCDPEALRRGLLELGERPPAVVLMALGGGVVSSRARPLVLDAVARLRRRGVVLVGALANGATGRHSYPACVPGVVPVAACDLRGRLQPYSGHCADVQRHGVLAPGSVVLDDDQGRAWSPMAGCSVAAAIVAGVVALRRAADPSMSAAAVRHLLSRSRRRPGSSLSLLDAASVLDALSTQTQAGPPWTSTK